MRKICKSKIFCIASLFCYLNPKVTHENFSIQVLEGSTRIPLLNVKSALGHPIENLLHFSQEVHVQDLECGSALVVWILKLTNRDYFQSQLCRAILFYLTTLHCVTSSPKAIFLSPWQTEVLFPAWGILAILDFVSEIPFIAKYLSEVSMEIPEKKWNNRFISHILLALKQALLKDATLALPDHDKLLIFNQQEGAIIKFFKKPGIWLSGISACWQQQGVCLIPSTERGGILGLLAQLEILHPPAYASLSMRLLWDRPMSLSLYNFAHFLSILIEEFPQ